MPSRSTSSLSNTLVMAASATTAYRPTICDRGCIARCRCARKRSAHMPRETHTRCSWLLRSGVLPARTSPNARAFRWLKGCTIGDATKRWRPPGGRRTERDENSSRSTTNSTGRRGRGPACSVLDAGVAGGQPLQVLFEAAAACAQPPASMIARPWKSWMDTEPSGATRSSTWPSVRARRRTGGCFPAQRWRPSGRRPVGVTGRRLARRASNGRRARLGGLVGEARMRRGSGRRGVVAAIPMVDMRGRTRQGELGLPRRRHRD